MGGTETICIVVARLRLLYSSPSNIVFEADFEAELEEEFPLISTLSKPTAATVSVR